MSFTSSKVFLHALADVVSRPHEVQIFERLAVILNNFSWGSAPMAEFCISEPLLCFSNNTQVVAGGS